MVDVVAPGVGRLQSPEGDFGGHMHLDRIQRRYLVETDCHEVLGKVTSYRAGALKLAEHHGYRPEQVEVDVFYSW